MALEKSLGGKSKAKKKSSKKSAPKHKIRHTHIEHGEDGSHVIRHSFDQPDPGADAGGGGEPPIPDSVHGVGDASGLLQHMQGQFGGQLPGADAGAGAAPGGAPGPAGM